MKKIILHWTAGPYARTGLDFIHYHYTIGQDGEVDTGKFEPSDNIPPLRVGQYAAHTGGGNSYAIGVALRGMAGYKNPNQVGRCPLTQKQCESAWEFVADLCLGYGIEVTSDTVMSHYEFGKKNPGTSSHGKIDITFLPFKPELKPDEVGDYIRGKIKWYMKKKISL